MMNLELFADRLSELMSENNLNAPALAEKLGINRSTVTRYLRGNKMPSIENLLLLADYFKCTTDFLLGLVNENYFSSLKKCPPFSVQLAFLLKKFKSNKYQLQKQTDIPQSAIYNWQRGLYTPTLENIFKIAKCFDCSVDFVLGREN